MTDKLNLGTKPTSCALIVAYGRNWLETTIKKRSYLTGWAPPTPPDEPCSPHQPGPPAPLVLDNRCAATLLSLGSTVPKQALSPCPGPLPSALMSPLSSHRSESSLTVKIVCWNSQCLHHKSAPVAIQTIVPELQSPVDFINCSYSVKLIRPYSLYFCYNRFTHIHTQGWPKPIQFLSNCNQTSNTLLHVK